jgi:hypothetical protein
MALSIRSLCFEWTRGISPVFLGWTRLAIIEWFWALMDMGFLVRVWENTIVA